jgi:STE24 endopeptidase
MQQLDAIEATAGWLAKIDRDTLETATNYTQGGHWLLMWDAAFVVTLCALLIRFRLLDNLVIRLNSRNRSPFVVGFFSSFFFFLSLSFLSLGWSAYGDWYRERQYDLATNSLGDWMVDYVIGAGLEALLLGIFFGVFYVLLKRVLRRRSMWIAMLAGICLSFFLLIYPLVIAPIFNSFEPAEPGVVRDAVDGLAIQADIRSDQILVYDGSSQSSRYTAKVSGLGGSARIMLSDTMFVDDIDLPAIKAVVAHEMGHYVEHHVAWTVVFYTAAVGILFWLIEILFPRVRILFGARSNTTLDDPAGLPIIIALFTALTLLATPVFSGFTRLLENRADQMSLQIAQEPDGLARALLRTVDYRAPSPSRLEELVFYDHPSIERRVLRAMRWKVENPGKSAAEF